MQQIANFRIFYEPTKEFSKSLNISGTTRLEGNGFDYRAGFRLYKSTENCRSEQANNKLKLVIKQKGWAVTSLD